jgi:uncharacterized membrane protein YozB (DUF420 family)
MIDVHQLPTVNATLNALAALCLIVGWFLIRARKRNAHRAVMIAALVCSSAFLACYLYYHYHVGSVRFPGTGPARTLYLSILLTHTALAALVPFLAVITVVQAARGRFARHKRIARWTLPIWLYVSVTGVVVYWMLYRMTW